MSPIWRALELVGADARTLPHWEKGLGLADLALLQPYLTPRAKRATSKPCEETFKGHFCRYRSPTLYDPSFMKTFRLRRGGVDVVRTYRDDAARSDILAVDWSEDIRVTSPVCARKLTAS